MKKSHESPQSVGREPNEAASYSASLFLSPSSIRRAWTDTASLKSAVMVIVWPSKHEW